MTSEQYHAFPAWSHSVIARYAREGFSSLATLHERVQPTASMRFGSLLDSMLTEGMAETLASYAVLETVPPDAERKVLETLAAGHTCPFAALGTEEIIGAADAAGYQPRWKPETRVARLSQHSGYYDILKSGKDIVPAQDWDDAARIVTVFRTDPYLQKVFGHGFRDGVEYLYQSKFFTDWTVDGRAVKIKIMPDLLIVNHNGKIIQPVDLKTSSDPAYSFADSFIKFRYDLQSELYTDVLRKICSEDGDFMDYAIAPYLFTDVSRSDMVPVTYTYDQSTPFSYTRNGIEYRYKGWQELLAEILSYEEAGAKVPGWIRTDGPNDIISIIERRYA